MKLFFTAKNYAGKIKSGEIEINDERELANKLRSEGYILTSSEEIEINKEKKKSIKFTNRFIQISLVDRLMFTRNLSVMISSGLPLSRAIKNISLQTKKKNFISILEKIYNDIQSGKSFADGLSKYPGVFNELFVNMIKVGEASGNLEEVLEILALQIEKEHDLKSKIRGAMIYPAVILVAMIGIAILMFTFVLPKLTKIFVDMNVELPFSTYVVILISNILNDYKILIGMLFIFLFISLKFLSMIPLGKKIISFLSVNIPLIKKMTIKINCARFLRIYSSLLKSGISTTKALQIISNTLTNYYYKNAIQDSFLKIQKGIPLSEAVSKYKDIFPIIVPQMIKVGEETGKTEEILLKLAEFYEEEISQISKNMSSIIEPILMIIIGSAVGFFAVSMFQPMYSIMDNIK